MLRSAHDGGRSLGGSIFVAPEYEKGEKLSSYFFLIVPHVYGRLRIDLLLPRNDSIFVSFSAIAMHFIFLAAFFWLNTMCFNIWWTFRCVTDLLLLSLGCNKWYRLPQLNVVWVVVPIIFIPRKSFSNCTSELDVSMDPAKRAIVRANFLFF